MNAADDAANDAQRTPDLKISEGPGSSQTPAQQAPQRATTNAHDWTSGAAKWFAVIVLGTASIAGMVWSIASRTPASWAHEPKPQAVEFEPTSPPKQAEGRLGTNSETKAYPRQPIAPASPAASVPKIPESTGTEQPRPDSAITPAKLDLNTATAAQLELLPGIGPAIAKRIIDYRDEHGKFAALESLDAVKGIGPKTIARLRPLVTVQ